MTDNDWEVNKSGTQRHLTEADLRIAALRQALWDIIGQESCLLADAKELAKDALKHDDMETQI